MIAIPATKLWVLKPCYQDQHQDKCPLARRNN